MGDWDKIAQWNAAAVRSISNDLNAQLNKLKGTEAELRAAATPKVWDGEGAEAAKKSLDGIERGVLHRVEEFASLRAATDDAADRIERLHEAMDATEHLARTNDFQIVDGAVVPRSDARAAEPGQGAATTNPEVKAALEAQVEQIVRAGMDIDADLTTVILSISDGKGWSDASTMAAAAKAGAASGGAISLEPPQNASPEQNKAWWDTLTDDERRWLINNKPDLIGNRKGLPYQARHEANVNRLDNELERLGARREQLKKTLESIGGNDRALLEEFARINDKLDALKVLKGQDKLGNMIMSLDTSGERVRAAVGIGDIDGADYLTVHTPGMNSAVEDNMNRYVQELTETTEYAQRMLDGTGKTAGTVVWMDYLPPKADVEEGPAGMSEDRAQEGAKRLAAELEGIQASRTDDPPQRLTATGHSYGSLTTALALRQTDAADAFVSQGSPGWGDEQSAGLQVPKGELYNMRTHDDFIVGKLGWHGGNVEDYAGVHQLGTQEATTADGERLRGTEGHSGYTIAGDGKSTSEHNTAAVIVGRDDLLVDAPPPREHTDTR